jgi:hypothetical protein
MNLTARLIGLTLGGALLLGLHKPPADDPLAKAVPLDPDGLSGADVRLIKTLNRHGVIVLTLGTCAPGVQASYFPQPNAIAICTNHPESDFSDTLRHEAVHAAQDCKAGQTNSELAILSPEGNPFLGTASHNELSRQLQADYPLELRSLEYEAWALARQFTSHQVTQLVADFCLPNNTHK